MGKSRKRGEPGVDQLLAENKSLKRQIKQLRKKVRKNPPEESEPTQDKPKEWTCWDCKQSELRIIILDRRDGKYYLRSCSNCGKRTPLKKWTKKVRE